MDGLQNNTPIILKLGFDKKSIRAEHASLSAFQNYGVVKLLAADFDLGALLLERAIPGQTLKSLFPNEDAEAMTVACRLIEQLHRAPLTNANTKNFPELTTWLEIIDKDWDLPKEHLERARALKTYLLDSAEQIVLLHGDLHYDNILSQGDRWVIIDPKGIIGDATYDKTGCLLREPLKELLETRDVLRILDNRIQLVSKYFNIPDKRLIQWTYVQTVMAICWCFEDNQNPSNMLKFLEIITSMMQSMK
jgi:streptomycin 6-kinase